MNLNLIRNRQSLFEKILEHENAPWLASGLVFATVHGSTCYGLATEASDIDIAGIMIPPRDYFFGFAKNCEQLQYNKPDGTIYNIRKFFMLAADANPNVMELLWVDPKYWIASGKVFSYLQDKRELFLSRKVRYTYAGYATAQLKRIKTHRRWLLDPPTHLPVRSEYGLTEQRLISKDQQGALNALVKEQPLDLTDNFMDLLRKENDYANDKRNWEQYVNWKNTRNQARAALEAEFGYDTKHAAHLVRLVRQCVEMLTTGTLVVERPDREELLAIRRGAWKYDDLMAFVEDQCGDENLDRLYNETTLLRYHPAREQLDELCTEIISEFLM